MVSSSRPLTWTRSSIALRCPMLCTSRLSPPMRDKINFCMKKIIASEKITDPPNIVANK